MYHELPGLDSILKEKKGKREIDRDDHLTHCICIWPMIYNINISKDVLHTELFSRICQID